MLIIHDDTTMECPLSPMAALPPPMLSRGTSRVVSPFLEQLQDTTTDEATNTKTIRLVIDRASPHATTPAVSSKTRDPPVKARRRRKHVRFHPTIRYHSRSSSSSTAPTTTTQNITNMNSNSDRVEPPNPPIDNNQQADIQK